MRSTSLPVQHGSWIALLLAASGAVSPLDARAASASQDASPTASAATPTCVQFDARAPCLDAPAPESIDLMLAEVYEGDADLAGYWVSEKLDGVRAYWNGRRLVSRGGVPIQAPEWFTRGFPDAPLDGELWIGPGRFEEVSGAVRRMEPRRSDWERIRYMVFDAPGLEASFGRRLEALRGLIAASGAPYLRLVEQFRVRDHADLMHRLARVEQRGGEGLMLHRDDSLYRGGRSHAVLKVKSYSDAEARVVGHVPGRGRLQGMLGSLVVEDEAGRRFRIGTGFSDAERRSPPPVGSLVTFTYQGRTERGIPRFASFLRARAPD